MMSLTGFTELDVCSICHKEKLCYEVVKGNQSISICDKCLKKIDVEDDNSYYLETGD